MKKITSLLLCLVLVLSAFTLTAAAEGTCMEAGVMAAEDGTVTVVAAKRLLRSIPSRPRRTSSPSVWQTPAQWPTRPWNWSISVLR